MADKKTRADLEILFSSGKIPTQSNFADLIASAVNQKDDGLQKAFDTALKIQAPVTVGADPKTPKDLILFYEKFEDAAAKCRMGIRSGGLEISRVDQSDFIIDANGKVGIGTMTPEAKLHIINQNQGAEVDTLILGPTSGSNLELGYGTEYSWIQSHGNKPLCINPSGNNVGIGTTDIKARLHVVGGAIMPAEGNSESAGILFPTDKFGGSSDRAYIRYYRRGETGESTTLEIGNQDNTDDHISLMPGGNVGIGTTGPKAKLHVIAGGGYGTENDDGTANGGNVPIVAQSNGTAFGIINGSGRPAFALNIEGDGGTKTERGAPTFIDRYDGNWHTSLCLKNGNVGIGINPSARLEVKGRIKDQTGFIMPVGSIIAFGGSAAPEGWLLCNGQAIPAGDAYKELRDVLGLANVPDLRGRTLICVADNHPLKQTGGEEMHTLTEAEMPKHHHAGFGEGYDDFPLGVVGPKNKFGSRGGKDDDNYYYNTTDTGGGAAHNNMQPFYVVNYIIKY